MFNPFKKHNEEHDDIYDVLMDLSTRFHMLELVVQELREEVDFLVDELDD